MTTPGLYIIINCKITSQNPDHGETAGLPLMTNSPVVWQGAFRMKPDALKPFSGNC